MLRYLKVFISCLHVTVLFVFFYMEPGPSVCKVCAPDLCAISPVLLPVFHNIKEFVLLIVKLTKIPVSDIIIGTLPGSLFSF